ncbi:MAG TPA: xanthine dehydrogenase molybdopterin binding subunit, partial [Woeseiaceae bacterium]|nr:xanthine dehydrogenase molybdopterin binding subunit [Woeseiaceae bacterium]
MVARAVGKPLPHDSAHLHVSGQATYTDDLPEPRDLLHLAVGMSAVAHANVRDLDLSDVQAADGVVDTCTAADICGENNYGSIIKDEPLLADGLVQYVGQPLFVVAAETVDAARKAAHKANVD